MHIGSVERETGVSRDVLRIWERRYRFPLPKRDRLGDRVYTRRQVETLRLIKRLMDSGHRPGAVVGRPHARLLAMLRDHSVPVDDGTTMTGSSLQLVIDGRMFELQARLERHLKRFGLPSFLLDALTPLSAAVGSAWAAGNLSIHQEHVYVDLAQALLRNAIDQLPRARRRPRVLLTTLSGEQHSLGLLMIRAMLSFLRVETVFLGAQVPIDEVAAAVRFHGADAVALSFSSAFSRHHIQRDVQALRLELPTNIELWIGGAGVQRLHAPIEGTLAGCTLEDAVAFVKSWKAKHPASKNFAAVT